jgi:hypothetical protein
MASDPVPFQRSEVMLGPPVLNRNITTVDPAEFAQPLHKSGDPLALRLRRGIAQEPDGRPLRRLLRAASGHATAPPNSS